jgi:hypothetical protein
MAFAIPVQAAKDYGNVVVSRVGTVYDGDTFKVGSILITGHQL